MEIRHATKEDIDEIMDIYASAREFMAENGNPTQWGTHYPKKDSILKDISDQNCYVCVENEALAGVFYFMLGNEPAYDMIEQGHWHHNLSYGVIHRLASSSRAKGVSKACFDYCKAKSSYIRIDTHADNKPMQAALRKNGFKQCGIIHVSDGSPRIAFDYFKEQHS